MAQNTKSTKLKKKTMKRQKKTGKFRLWNKIGLNVNCLDLKVDVQNFTWVALAHPLLLSSHCHSIPSHHSKIFQELSLLKCRLLSRNSFNFLTLKYFQMWQLGLYNLIKTMAKCTKMHIFLALLLGLRLCWLVYLQSE